MKEVRFAFDFAKYVDAITKIVPDARKLILDGNNPHLTPSIVQRIVSRSETGIKSALTKATNGLHPFAPNLPNDWQDERALSHYDFNRLDEAKGLLERVITTLERPKPTPRTLFTRM